MKTFNNILISLIILVLLGSLGLFIYNKFQEVQIEKDKVEVELMKLKNSKSSTSVKNEKKDVNTSITNPTSN